MNLKEITQNCLVGKAIVLFVVVGCLGCGPSPNYRAMTAAEVGDLRSSIGEKRPILDVAEYGPTIHVILEFPRSADFPTVDRECSEAARHMQDEIRTGDHSKRSLIVWAHSEPNEDSTFRIFGYAETDSASGEITWKSNTRPEQELPVPKSR